MIASFTNRLLQGKFMFCELSRKRVSKLIINFFESFRFHHYSTIITISCVYVKTTDKQFFEYINTTFKSIFLTLSFFIIIFFSSTKLHTIYCKHKQITTIYTLHNTKTTTTLIYSRST